MTKRRKTKIQTKRLRQKKVTTTEGKQSMIETKDKADDFIMLPTVDFCFKELMNNEKVRKGIIVALLGVTPSEVEETTLMPTILRKESQDDKYGILDVRVKLKNGIAKSNFVMLKRGKYIQILWKYMCWN